MKPFHICPWSHKTSLKSQYFFLREGVQKERRVDCFYWRQYTTNLKSWTTLLTRLRGKEGEKACLMFSILKEMESALQAYFASKLRNKKAGEKWLLVFIFVLFFSFTARVCAYRISASGNWSGRWKKWMSFGSSVERLWVQGQIHWLLSSPAKSWLISIKLVWLLIHINSDQINLPTDKEKVSFYQSNFEVVKRNSDGTTLGYLLYFPSNKATTDIIRCTNVKSGKRSRLWYISFFKEETCLVGSFLICLNFILNSMSAFRSMQYGKMDLHVCDLDFTYASNWSRTLLPAI